MKLRFDVAGKTHPDPFILEDGGRFYIYATAIEGVEAYSSDDLLGTWHYEGVVTKLNGEGSVFWAPSVIRYGGKYYMYVAFNTPEVRHAMHVFCADSPLGPFTNEKELYHRFSIDSHAVETDAGLFLFFAQDVHEGERIGTRVFVDKLLDPYTPEGKPVEKIVPTFDEEIYAPTYTKEHPWHTIEGPTWFCEGEWQYLMYSGGCYQNDTYHIGYAAAKTGEQDLRLVHYEKFTDNGKFAPVLIKNEVEEGTGHHSVIKYNGEYYAFYHARDYGAPAGEARTARVCRLHVKDGVITAERM